MSRVLCLLTFTAIAAFAQTAPAFDVATVKPSLPPGAAGRVGRVADPFFDPGRVSWWNVPLRFYTMQAYGVTTAWRIETIRRGSNPRISISPQRSLRKLRKNKSRPC